MRNELVSKILVYLALLFLSVKHIKGKSHYRRDELTSSMKDTINDLHHDLRRVSHFLRHLSEIDAKRNKTAGYKSRSAIPLYQRIQEDMLADESIIKATARKAAKAVKDSYAATLQTQKGVKRISKGLVQLKKCLENFGNTIKV